MPEIRPDFQMELENIDVMRVMDYAVENYDLSGICLVASSTVERRVKDHFDQIVYWFPAGIMPVSDFFRKNGKLPEAPRPHGRQCLPQFSPRRWVFREYYFFGTDMGQKDSDQHHAKSSYHYTDAAKDDRLQEFNIEVPANFGGKSKTSTGLFWALDTLQRAISYTAVDFKYFNCSNGARINRARALLSRNLNLPEPEISREQAVQDIMDGYPAMSSEDFNERWQPEKMIRALTEIFDELVDVVETSDLIRGTDHLVDFARIFYATKEDPYEHYASLVLRGTINTVFIACDYYLCRLNDEAKYDSATEVCREEFRVLIERLRNVVTKHIRARERDWDLDEQYLNGAIDEDGLTDEQRAELLATPDTAPDEANDEMAQQSE